jgi:hypothetical protein
MLRVGAKGRQAAIVRDLELPVPFDLGQFLAGLERQRERHLSKPRSRPWWRSPGGKWPTKIRNEG